MTSQAEFVQQCECLLTTACCTTQSRLCKTPTYSSLTLTNCKNGKVTGWWSSTCLCVKPLPSTKKTIPVKAKHKLRSITLESVTCAKCLGVHISSKLTWNDLRPLQVPSHQYSLHLISRVLPVFIWPHCTLAVWVTVSVIYCTASLTRICFLARGAILLVIELASSSEEEDEPVWNTTRIGRRRSTMTAMSSFCLKFIEFVVLVVMFRNVQAFRYSTC